jgi:hypothetical protein
MPLRCRFERQSSDTNTMTPEPRRSTVPRNPLDLQINLARHDAEHAGRRLAELCVAAASIPIRAHYPTATAVIVGVDDWAVRKRGTRLLAVLGSLGTLLWVFDAVTPELETDGDSEPEMGALAMPADAATGARWEQLRDEAEDLFSQAVRHTSPALLHWHEESNDSGAAADAFRIDLPTSPAVPHHQAAAEDAAYLDHGVVALACELEVTGTEFRTVRCKTHDVADTLDAADAETALRRFHCDRGRRWTFLVHRTIHKEDHGPRLMTLSELVGEIRYWLEDDHAGGYTLGSAVEQILTVRRYLPQACMHVPLDVRITALSGSTALVWIADMDCRIVPPRELVDSDAYAVDGVTYLYTVIDLNDAVIDAPAPGSADKHPGGQSTTATR